MASPQHTVGRERLQPRVPGRLATNDSHDRVIHAALRLFATRGFHGTGIRDLASEAGLSTSALYHYMGTKEELLFQIMQDCLDRLLVAAHRIAERAEPVNRISGLIAVHVLSHALQQDASLVVDNELGSLESKQRAAAIAQRDEYEAIWKSAIADGVASGQFCVPDERLARFALLEICSGVARWYTEAGPQTLRQIVDYQVQLGLSLLGHSGAARGDADLGEIVQLFESVWQISIP